MTNQIIHDPTRGWLLLTEKWPEEKPECDCDVDGAGDFESQQEACARRFKTYNDTVNSCLSTAIDIAKEDWPMVDAKVRQGLGGDILHSVIQDHHPYSVDAEFEVKEQYRSLPEKDWKDRGAGGKIGAFHLPDFEYRKIARLVKAKEKPVLIQTNTLVSKGLLHGQSKPTESQDDNFDDLIELHERGFSKAAILENFRIERI